MPESTSGEGEARTVNSVATACNILDELQARNGAGITEIANELGVSKSAVHAHLSTLRDREFVVKDGEKYRLSLKFLDVGRHVKQRLNVYEVAVEETKRLAEESGEVAQFMTEEHGIGVYLYKESGENGIRTASYTGNREYLHCTALGKAILSELPAERVDEIVDRRGLPQQTQNTITDRETLFTELETIRDRGLAYDRGEILEGLRCIAAPVTASDGALLGAISVSGPVSRMASEAVEEELKESIRHSANVIEINASRVRS